MNKRALILTALLLLGVALIRLGAAGRFAVYAPLLLFGPGYLIERWLRPAVPPLARPGLWLALSLALVPLIYLWATQLAVPITPFRLFMGLLALAAALLWVLQARQPAAADATSQAPERDSLPYEPLLLLLILALTGWTRLRQIADLALPPWVDSLHHALMIRVAQEQGMVPFSLRPYLPIDQLMYHWGYHVTAASLWQATGLPLPTLMLWLGQLLSTLTVVALGCCGLALWRRPGAALIAGMIPGLLSVMPAYYLSWGRYTLLAGHLILPALMLASAELIRERTIRNGLLVGLLLAGLYVIHFVVFVFALAWCAAAWLALAVPGQRRRACIALLAAGVAALLLTMPWTLDLLARVRPGTGSSALHVAGNESYNAMPEGLLWASNNRLLLAIAGAGALIGLWRRHTAALALVFWSLIVMLLANPVWLGLPYLSFVTNSIVASSLFAPVGLLIGGSAALSAESILRWASAARRSILVGAGCAGLLILAGWQAWRFQSVVRSDTIIATAADLRAIQWVAANIPADARFAVNTEGWLGEVDRGADGGWWLLPLAGRQVSAPPVIFNYGTPEYTAAVKAQTQWIRNHGSSPPAELAEFMRRHGYTHAYATSNGRTFNVIQLRGAVTLFEELYATPDAAVGIFRLR